jgi:hypothetical protein
VSYVSLDEKEGGIMIAYKVVDHATRYGSNAAGYIYHNGLYEFDKLLADMPALKPYFPKYEKDRIITAPHHSVGIICFLHKDTAIAFRDKYSSLKITQVIAVEGYIPMRHRDIASDCIPCPSHILQVETYMMKPPIGCLFFKRVRVLE